MRVDLGFEEGQFGIEFLGSYLFITLFGFQPLVDHLDTCAEDEDQEEDGDISGGEEGLLKIVGSSGVGGAHSRRLRLKTAEIIAKEIMIEPGKASIENQESDDDKGIGDEFLVFQQFGYDQVGVDVIEGNQQECVRDEKGGEIPF